MTNSTPVSASFSLQNTALAVATLPFQPFLYVINKIHGLVQGVFGYLVRLGVFSFGEWNRSYIKRKIIELYKGGCLDVRSREKFDPKRLEKAFTSLECVGGIRSTVTTRDGVSLDSMLIRYGDVVKQIEANGGKIVSALPVLMHQKKGIYSPTSCSENHGHPNRFVDLILPNKDTEKWDSFSSSVLSNLGLKKIEVQLGSGEKVIGFIAAEWRSQNPTRPKPGQCFIRFNSPTESYPMAKKDIMRRVLALRGDALCFDYPGTWKSKGFPSEGGYYTAGKAMLEKAMHGYGYSPKNIWLDGFCLGSSVAIHLFAEYHEKGVNFFGQNPFDTMEHTLRNQIFPANWMAPIGLKEVQSRDPLIRSLVDQNGFDNLKTLEKLSTKHGTSIFVNTNTDTTIDKEAPRRLAKALERVSEQTFPIMYYPKDQNSPGHGADVNASRKVFVDQVIPSITAKDYPWVLRGTPTLWQRFRYFLGTS